MRTMQGTAQGLIVQKADCGSTCGPRRLYIVLPGIIGGHGTPAGPGPFASPAQHNGSACAASTCGSSTLDIILSCFIERFAIDAEERGCATGLDRGAARPGSSLGAETRAGRSFVADVAADGVVAVREDR